jgi:hypothetical protein
MRTWVLWTESIGALVAAVAAVGLAAGRVLGDGTPDAVWFWLWIPGAAVWLIGELVEPSPGYRFVSRPPFLTRRTAVSDLEPESPPRALARRALRAAFAVHTSAFGIYLIAELIEAVTPTG